MQQQIREWIKNNRQPWINSYGESTKLNKYARSYFSRIGVDISDKDYEELLDDELIRVYNDLLNCLNETDKEKLEYYVAIGYSRTYEPNACCIKHSNGYAILFDQYFDSLLISLTEQCLATFIAQPPLLSFNEYIVYSNNSILSIFFGLSPYVEPIDTENFYLREFVNEWVYTITTFIIAHEIAHIVLNHNNDTNLCKSVYTSSSSDNEFLMYKQSIQNEYEADSWALRFIINDMKKIIFEKNDPNATNPSMVWGYIYIRIGWFFAILDSIEVISNRVNIPLENTHPPALTRWDNVSNLFLEKREVHPYSLALFETIKNNIINSASSGPLPKLDYELMDKLINTRINHQKN